jgi:hypothetical protein
MISSVIEVCPTCSFLVARTDAAGLLPAHIDVRRGAWCAGSARPTLRLWLGRAWLRWARLLGL